MNQIFTHKNHLNSLDELFDTTVITIIDNLNNNDDTTKLNLLALDVIYAPDRFI